MDDTKAFGVGPSDKNHSEFILRFHVGMVAPVELSRGQKLVQGRGGHWYSAETIHGATVVPLMNADCADCMEVIPSAVEGSAFRCHPEPPAAGDRKKLGLLFWQPESWTMLWLELCESHPFAKNAKGWGTRLKMQNAQVLFV